MKFQVITLFPPMIEAMTAEGVIAQAKKKGLISVESIQPRDFTEDTHKTVDDRPFGGGDGMLMMIEPLKAAISMAKSTSSSARVIYLSPQGVPLDQDKVEALAQESSLILVCGRYAGIDQRIINQYVDEEISIGDYVLSGGELAAGVIIDAVSRQLPGVLGHADSVEVDSFSSEIKGLLEAPSFTRPREHQSGHVPEILLSGNHKKIAEWKSHVSILVTLLKRPDLLFEKPISAIEKKNILQFWKALSEADKNVLGLRELREDDFEWLEKGDLK